MLPWTAPHYIGSNILNPSISTCFHLPSLNIPRGPSTASPYSSGKEQLSSPIFESYVNLPTSGKHTFLDQRLVPLSFLEKELVVFCKLVNAGLKGIGAGCWICWRRV